MKYLSVLTAFTVWFATTPMLAKVNHSTWDNLLQKYVTTTGAVDYVGFKKDAVQLEAYLNILSTNAPQQSWSRNEQLAYWINAYNAFTVKLIVDNYPLKSIRDLHNGKPWDVKWIKIGGQTYSLNQIENEIIRPQFKESRIHFAVNCAAKSCPPLLNRAYTAAKLNEQLASQTKKFINNTAYNSISNRSVKVSQIFNWYSVDFGDLVSYLNKYARTSISSKANVEFAEYDWALNTK